MTPASRGSSTVANEDGLVALGAAIERRGARRRNGRRRSRRRGNVWLRRGLVVGVVAVVLIGAAGLADYIYLGTLGARVKVNNLQSTGTSTNILLVGSTDRCALKVQNAAYGLCSQGVTGVNSDIVMVAHLGANGQVALLSIPRDLFVPNARTANNANKIDAALFDGPSQLAVAIEEDFGIPINHYVELNFDTFANVVNAVGGIDMYFPLRVFDAESGLHIQQPGCYHLDGIHALQVVRARHLQIQHSAADGTNPRLWPQEAQSDLARIRRTHEFMRIVAAKISAMGIDNPIQDQNLATTILPDLTFDNGFSEGEMVSLATTYAGTKISQVPQLTYPVILNQSDPLNGDSYLYEGYFYGDVEFPLQPAGWQAVDKVFGVAADESPWDGKVLPASKAFPISVENGTGVPNQAATVATALGHWGYDVTQTGDRSPVGTTSETVVYYGGPPPPPNGNWSSQSLTDALKVMTQIQGPVTLGYDPAEVTHGDVVTVQTGSDISIANRNWAAPPPPPTTSTSTSSTSSTIKSTTTTTAPTTSTVYDPPGVSTDNNFSAPSAPVQALQPWDPRACTASMKVMDDKS
jgi:LCP family protein required for cell wall assembly